jgi:hypothetical protein
VDLTGLVMRDGVVARASGRVLVIDGTVWFERPGARTLPLTSRPRPPHPGRYAVRAHGVNLDRLDRAVRHEGGIFEGWTTVTGTWRRHELHVSDQTSISVRDARTDRWTTPPCPPPAAGWPTAPVYGGMSAANLPARPPEADEQRRLTITQLTQFRPHATQPVLVVAAEDPERAERALRPTFGAALCVVPSRYRQQEIDETLQRLRDEMSSHRWPMTSNGRSAGDDGQPTVVATFAWIEPEVAEWAATVPDGLLDLDVWLTPVG